MISSKRAQQRETLWMPDKQGLVSVTMANKPEESISGREKEEESATYSVGTTLRTLPMQKKTKTETRKNRAQVTERGKERKRKMIKINKSSNHQMKETVN